jgi:hypothetical protein
MSMLAVSMEKRTAQGTMELLFGGGETGQATLGADTRTNAGGDVPNTQLNDLARNVRTVTVPKL